TGVADIGERRRQRGDQLRIQRVPAVGARERDAQERSVALDAERRCRCHSSSAGSLASSALICRRRSASLCPKSSRYDLSAAWTMRSSSGVSSILGMGGTYRAVGAAGYPTGPPAARLRLAEYGDGEA